LCRSGARSERVAVGSPVRTRSALSTSRVKILPSPILPVWAVLVMVSTTWSASAVGHDDLELHLRHEVHRVFGAAVDFGVARLGAEALDFGHHHAAHADGR
jgi:hypothetical protein